MRIGIVGFSSSLAPDALERAKQYAASVGVEFVLPFDPSLQYGKSDFLFSSASAETRIQALEQLLEDSTIDAIVSARGAYGSMELLEGLPAEALRAHKKPIFGLSDTTALLIAIKEVAQEACCVHATTVMSGFAKAAQNELAAKSVTALLSYIRTGKTPTQTLQLCSDYGSGEQSSEIQGELVGGNLSMLVSLLGTPWSPEYFGKILFIEEIGERPYKVLRMLTQLRLAGAFAGLQAVLLGDFLQCTHAHGATLEMVFREFFLKLKIPVFKGLACGHGEYNLPLEIGALASIDVSGSLSVR